MVKTRKDYDLPQAVEEWGWRFHHLGIPTEEPMADERYLPQFGFYVSGFETSPFGIEWMRFDQESPVHELIKRIPHLAFEVDDLDHELACRGLEILTPPNSPGEGTRVAMVLHNGAPVELIEFRRAHSPSALPRGASKTLEKSSTESDSPLLWGREFQLHKIQEMTIRDLEPGEVSSLEDFMYDAIFIPEGVERPAREIIYLPELACYFRDFGREHDHCLVAEIGGELVGAVWTRLYHETRKGYGYVDDHTPEVSMSVKTPFRQKGFGTRLLTAMLKKLQQAGYQQVSLSVDEANYAYRMYQKAGFVTVASDGISATMIKRLQME